MNLALRRRLLPLHLRAGLTVGLVLVVVVITGASLIFRSALERPMSAARFIVPAGATRLTPDELVTRVRSKNPAADLERIRFYSEVTAPARVRAVAL